MLTISLHGIQLHAKIGLYPEEKIDGNEFEIDVDLSAETAGTDAFPFIDYTIIHQVVDEAFRQPGELLETFVRYIHQGLKERFPEAGRVRVAIRKMQPPLEGTVRYSQVAYEA